MRILHLINHTKRYNGMVHAAVDLACAQGSIGHDVGLCSAGGDFGDVLHRCGVSLFQIDQLDSPRPRLSSLFSIIRVLKRFKPDVVHAHMVVSALLAYPATRLLKIPLVTCVQNSSSRASALMMVGDRVITGCRAVADTMVARGISRRKLRPILNGTIGSVRFAGPVPDPLPLSRPAIITICGLHARKGVDDVIRALGLSRDIDPSLHLYIVGEGPQEIEYRRMVSEKDKAHVHFCGYSPDTRQYMRAADIFVLASLADPAPLVLSEAREAGLAVIATSVDGIPEMLEDGRAGILVPPRAPHELAAQITALVSNQQSLAAWKRNSQVNIERLSLRRVTEQTLDVYRECVEGDAERAAEDPGKARTPDHVAADSWRSAL